MRLKAISRRENQKSYNRTQILQTAQELFSNHGFHDVSMHLIAEESGFSIGTLYNFFKDKEDLYGVLVKDNFLAFHHELVQALDGPGDEVERIRAYVSAKGRIFQNNRSMMRLYFAETRASSFDIKSGLNVELRTIYEDFMQRLAAVFESGIQRGLFRPLMEPYYLAVALASLTNAFLFLWLEDPVKHPYSQNVEIIMQGDFRKYHHLSGRKEKTEKENGWEKMKLIVQ